MDSTQAISSAEIEKALRDATVATLSDSDSFAVLAVDTWQTAISGGYVTTHDGRVFSFSFQEVDPKYTERPVAKAHKLYEQPDWSNYQYEVLRGYGIHVRFVNGLNWQVGEVVYVVFNDDNEYMLTVESFNGEKQWTVPAKDVIVLQRTYEEAPS